MDIYQFNGSLIQAAKNAGLSKTNPITLNLMVQPDGSHVPTQLKVQVSYSSPAAVDDALWLNPTDANMYLCGSAVWTPLDSGNELYSTAGIPSLSTAEGGGGGGSTDSVSKAYVDAKFVEALTAMHAIITTPVATLNDLRTLDASTIIDKQMVYVESVKSVYAYDLQGTGVDDNQNTIVPNSGVGRWYATTPGTLDGGSF